jgi:hypothetical protein
MTLLKIVMGFLNLGQTTSPNPLAHEQPTYFGLFGLVASTQEAITGLFKVELSLFCKFHVENVDVFDSLMWWATKQV